MKVQTKEDAAELAYCLGTVCNFGKVKLEGIGHRLTNWAMGTTFSFEGINKRWAQECLAMFSDIPLSRPLNVKHYSVALTTFQAAQDLCCNLGVLDAFRNAVDIVKDFDAENETGKLYRQGNNRVNNKAETIQVILECKQFIVPMTQHAFKLINGILTEQQITRAFVNGMEGLALGSDDLQRLAA